MSWNFFCLIFLFVDYLYWFFSCWNWFCSWNLLGADLLRGTCCVFIFDLEAFSQIDFFLQETCTLIFLLVKLLSFMELVAYWFSLLELVAWWFFFEKLDTCWFFCITCVYWNSFSIWNRCYSWKLLRADFASWNMLHLDFSLCETCKLIFPLVKRTLLVKLPTCKLLFLRLVACLFFY